MGRHPFRTLVESIHCYSTTFCLSLIPFRTLFLNIVTNLYSVLADTAISIAFGLIGTILGLVSVFISYLTLRAMTLDSGRNAFLFSFNCLFLFSFNTEILLSYKS
jgi:hypothetical protein